MERQSSMASSTEEVSVANNDFSGGSRRDDTTTDFGVFKDFDFLEYESESIEGESTDNFNWGVRRRPLSEGEEEPPSIKQHDESVSEQTPILTVRKRVAAEESSDDEVGSESPLDEIAVAPEFESSSAGISAVFPPSSLSLGEHRPRRDSSTRSDTSGSSAGDLGDVTPCNASPNLSSLVNIRPNARNDTVELWTAYVQNTITQSPANTVQLFHQLQKLIKNISNSTIIITRESCSYLTQSATAGLPTIKLISSRLSSLIDIISHRILQPHLIWFNSSSVHCIRLTETLRFGMLEVQEHLETFCDKRDQATMYSDAIKTSVKLEMLSGQQTDARNDEYLLDLGRALYKLHFQLLLLIEATNKMVTTLVATLRNLQFQDITPDILSIRSALCRAIEDREADGGTPTPASASTRSPAPTNNEELESVLHELVINEKWSALILFIKHHRGHLSLDVDPENDDDIGLILNVYCKKLVQDRPDCFVITSQETDLADIFGRLFQVSAAVSDLESVIKERDQPDCSTTSQAKD